VYEASWAVKIPVIGLGGIEKPDEILEYMIVGASAVQIGTANFANPEACQKLVDGLERACMLHKINKINSLIGSLKVDYP
jgi:dihydroorotate dehydrogenase (NAD+) catalytic subunit